MPNRFTLGDARAMVRRAIDKAEELKERGAFVVVNHGGILLSASRMDGAGSIGLAISRAKAYEAAANQETSATLANRLNGRPTSLYAAYQEILREKIFPGAGAVPIMRDGSHVGAISTAADISPHVRTDAVAAEQLFVDGEPANFADLVISYALGLNRYFPQHGDDKERWVATHGALPDPIPKGIGLRAAPAAKAQTRLDVALALVDRALEEAERRRVHIAAAVTDDNGDLVQIDRMMEAAPMTVDFAEAKAVTALNFQTATSQLPEWAYERTEVAALVRFPFIPIAGGVPLRQDGKVVGALGIAGSPSVEVDEEIAMVALSQT